MEELAMDYDSLLELVKKRRSIRRFKSDSVPDESVEKIIEVARWAPSGLNIQPWEFVVVKDRELKDRIVKLSEAGGPIPRDPMDFSNAPVYIILLGDPRTKAGLPPRLAADNKMNQPVFNSSLANAFLYMHLAAAALGLASQWMSRVGLPFMQPELKKLLGIPEGFQVYDMMVVGYPAIKAREKLLRPKDKMIHYGTSEKDDFRTDEEVEDFANRTRTWAMATIRRDKD
jgi:nitroreductase